MKTKKLNLAKALDQGAALPRGGARFVFVTGIFTDPKTAFLPCPEVPRALEMFALLAPANWPDAALLVVDGARVVAARLGAGTATTMTLQTLTASLLAGEDFLLHAVVAEVRAAQLRVMSSALGKNYTVKFGEPFDAEGWEHIERQQEELSHVIFEQLRDTKPSASSTCVPSMPCNPSSCG